MHLPFVLEEEKDSGLSEDSARAETMGGWPQTSERFRAAGDI